MRGARCYPPHVALHCTNPTRQIASQMMAYGVGGVPGPGDWSHFFCTAPLYPGGPLKATPEWSYHIQGLATRHFWLLLYPSGPSTGTTTYVRYECEEWPRSQVMSGNASSRCATPPLAGTHTREQALRLHNWVHRKSDTALLTGTTGTLCHTHTPTVTFTVTFTAAACWRIMHSYAKGSQATALRTLSNSCNSVQRSAPGIYNSGTNRSWPLDCATQVAGNAAAKGS
jgi:hypothetical protein